MKNTLPIAIAGLLGLGGLAASHGISAEPAPTGPGSVALEPIEAITEINTEIFRFYDTVTCRTRFPDIGKWNGRLISPGAIIPLSGTKDFLVPRFVSYVLVDDNGSGADFSNISDALAATGDGDYIYVCPGTYNERFTVNNDVKLIGLDGADTTIIDAAGTGDGTVVGIAGSVLLRGFTITGSSADFSCYYGGGIKVSGEASDSHNYPVIEQNKIVDNHACKVGGIYLSGFSNAGGDRTDNTVIVRNNIIARNEAGTSNAGGIMVDSDKNIDTEIYNNVIADNSTVSGAGGVEVIGSGYSIDLRNNVFYANSGYALRDYSGSAVVEYNDSYANGVDYSGGTGNLTDDPQFVDSVDFELGAASSLIDAGDPDAAYDDGDGSRNDMGAYGGSRGNW